jgi:ABC-type dipeptide/oligopeptide/nickel transport system permease subunit
MRIGPLGFLQYTSAAIGFWIVIFWIVVAGLAPVPAPYPPNSSVGKNVAGPSQTNLLGTDNMGRDILSRTLWGAQPILVLSPIVVACATVLGVILGLIAGYMGGVADDILMRLLDAVMAFPTLLLYLIIIAAVGPSRINVLLAITIGGFPGVARLVRSMVLDVKNREFGPSARLFQPPTTRTPKLCSRQFRSLIPLPASARSVYRGRCPVCSTHRPGVRFARAARAAPVASCAARVRRLREMRAMAW